MLVTPLTQSAVQPKAMKAPSFQGQKEQEACNYLAEKLAEGPDSFQKQVADLNSDLSQRIQGGLLVDVAKASDEEFTQAFGNNPEAAVSLSKQVADIAKNLPTLEQMLGVSFENAAKQAEAALNQLGTNGEELFAQIAEQADALLNQEGGLLEALSSLFAPTQETAGKGQPDKLADEIDNLNAGVDAQMPDFDKLNADIDAQMPDFEKLNADIDAQMPDFDQLNAALDAMLGIDTSQDKEEPKK